MAAFYLDEDVSHHIVPLLRAIGHTVVTARGAGRNRTTDDQQLFHAWQNHRILVTHNGKDFALIHATLRRWANQWSIADIHAGILVTPTGMNAREEARLLDIFAVSELPVANAMYAWKPNGAWIRREPRDR